MGLFSRRSKKLPPYTTPGYRQNSNIALTVGGPLVMIGLMLLFSAYAGAGNAFWIAGGIITLAGVILSSSGRVY